MDRLDRIVPEGLSSFFFASSGSEVVDNAIKLARAATKRTNIICFDVRINIDIVICRFPHTVRLHACPSHLEI